MASNDKDVVVRIGGDAKGLDAATQAARKTIGGFAADTRKAFSGLGGQIFSLRGALGTIAAGFSLKSVIDATVDAERIQALLEARLRSTGRTAEFTAQQLSDMGDRLREGTTFDDESLAQAQTTLLNFGRVAGQTFEGATTAALDLSTALGTDLNAAAELVGRALQQPDKAAKQLRSANILLTESEQKKIKALVEGGKVAEAQAVVLGKLQTAYGGAAKAAGNTLGGALAELKNTLGDLLEGEGGSLTDATQGVKDLSATLKSPAVKDGFASLTAGVITLVGWLAKLASGAAAGAKAVGEFFGRLAVGSTVPFQNEIDELLAKIKNTESQLSGAKFFRFPTEQYEKDLQRYRAELGKAQAAQADFLAMKPGVPAVANGALAGPLPGLGAPADDDDQDAPSGKGGADKAANAARQRAQAVAAAESAVFKARQDRERASLEALNAQNLLSLQDYHAQKLALELAAIDAEVAAKTAALKSADEAERIRAQGEIEALSIQRTAAVEAGARDQAEAERALGEERLELEQRLLEATGRNAEARAQAIEREFADLIAKLKAQGDTAGVAIAVELKGVELARSEFERLEGELSSTMDGYQRRLQEIDTAVQTGALTRSQARREQVSAAEALVTEEERIADALQAQASIIGDPAALERVRALRQEILITGQVTDEAFNQIRGAFDDGFVGLFEDLQRAPEDAEEAVENALSSIEASIQRIIAQRLGEGLVDSLFGGLKRAGSGGGGFDIGGFLGGLFGGGGGFDGSSLPGLDLPIGHSGQVIGQPGPTKRVPALTIASLPRYHAGGMLGADEVPFIGLKGERVLNREETRNYNARQGGAPVVNVSIAAPDPNAFRVARPQVEASIGSALQRAMLRNR